MAEDQFERVGTLATESYRNEKGAGARAPEVFRCRRCGALVADTLGKVDHTRWHTINRIGLG